MGKLVRDKIPDIIRQSGILPKTIILTENEYSIELDKKLDEEVAEYHKDHTIDELIDILEVIVAIGATKGYSLEDLLLKRLAKRIYRGGFDNKIFWLGNEDE